MTAPALKVWQTWPPFRPLAIPLKCYNIPNFRAPNYFATLLDDAGETLSRLSDSTSLTTVDASVRCDRRAAVRFSRHRVTKGRERVQSTHSIFTRSKTSQLPRFPAVHIVSVCNNKGGVGKSTITVGLAEFLAGNRDKRVLVIDMDYQASSACALLGRPTIRGALEKRRTLAALMSALRQDPRDLTAEELGKYVVIRRGTDARGSSLGNIDVLIPDGEEMAELDDVMDCSKADQCLLRRHLVPALTEYDFVLIDMPAALKRRDVVQINGLTVSDFVLIPVAPSMVVLRSLPHTLKLIRHAREINGDDAPEILGMLRNFTDRRTQQYRAHFREIEQLCREERLPPLFKNYWPYMVDLQKATDDERDSRTLKQRFEGSSYDAVRLVARELQDRCARFQAPRGVRARSTISYRISY